MGASAAPQVVSRAAGASAAVASRVQLAERRPAATMERVAVASRQSRPVAEPARRADPLDEIRQRQRALDSDRDRSYARQEEFAPPLRQPAPSRASEARFAERQPAPQRPVAAPTASPAALGEIAEALVALRHDLKKDIADGVAREMGALRAEIRTIKSDASEQNFATGMREDLARLAESINQLADHGAKGPEAVALKAEFDDLRSLMDGLAREDSVRVMENRWDMLEDRLQAMDTSSMQEELVALAYRIDDIKRQLGGMNDSPAVHALEDKLISIATAMEQLGNMIQPRDRAMADQFTAIDSRLDEISRAIVASGRTAANAADPALIQRLENRIAALGDQIDVMSNEALARYEPTSDLAARIEGLTIRIEEMAHAESAINLDARLAELSRLLENSQKPAAQPELTRHLTDISRKIDALDQGAVNDVLAERLEQLARRIEKIDVQVPAPAMDDAVVFRLESRLADIAARLEESTAAPPTDNHALHALEDQIAHLSVLLSEPQNALPAAFDERMNAIEQYMSTNDEYVIEAARQAAEAVVQAYGRNGAMSGGAGEAEMSAIAALADDLRHLEDISRNSDERTHRTFEALHDTLVQIADRLDNIERQKPAPRMPAAEYAAAPFDYAEAPAARPAAAQAAASSALNRGGPVVRAAPVNAPYVDDEPVSDGYPIDEETKAQIKEDVKQETTGKPGLFASLGKKLRSGRKADASAAADRAMIDPTPSIDPVDAIYSEEPNELLEPGSGAPDIKKILEKVRASQNAARHGNAKPQSESERADYIAAARRAAQAAALEVDQAPRAASAPKIKGAKAGAFARFRRPILLAVGAALLAIMAYPLVNTLTHGQKAPPAEVAALTSAATPPAPAAAPAMPAVAATPAAPTAVAPAMPDTNAAALTTTAPAAAAPTAAPVDPLAPAVRPSTDPTAPAAAAQASAPAPVDPAPASLITVPDSVQPPALADAARKGDGLALFEIGSRFTDGRGVTTDLKQAANWYQLSADKGFAPAQYRLASMYEKGNGVERDLAKAKQYYQMAADQGNASAMHNLAVLFASGAAGQQDYATAVDWFTKAANFGISDSQFNLAILYARGSGVKQDLGESYKWFAIAAKAGDKDAAEKRDQVANALKPDQLQAAKAQVDLWKPQPVESKANNADIPDEWSGKGVHTASIDVKKAIRNIQAILNNNGFDAGPPDGSMGDKTVTALKNFQKSVGLPADGKITDAVVKELLARNKPA